jgi:hypothetical protein
MFFPPTVSRTTIMLKKFHYFMKYILTKGICYCFLWSLGHYRFSAKWTSQLHESLVSKRPTFLQCCQAVVFFLRTQNDSPLRMRCWSKHHVGGLGMILVLLMVFLSLNLGQRTLDFQAGLDTRVRFSLIWEFLLSIT